VLRYPFHHLSSAALTVWKKIGSGILNEASMTWYEGSVAWSTKDFCGPCICVQAVLPCMIIPVVLIVDQRYYPLTRMELISRKIRWKDSRIIM